MLNEVGGDLRRFGLSVEGFHPTNAEHRARWPHGMLCTSSHDTKRSEDVRARRTVLSEISGEWRSHVLRWIRLNRDKKRDVGGEPAPAYATPTPRDEAAAASRAICRPERATC